MSESAPIGKARLFAWGTLGCIAACAALVAQVYWFDPAFRPGHGAEGDIGLAALNALPIALFVLLLFALTRRPLLAYWCGALLAALLQGINALKLEAIATPLLPSDFQLIGQLHGGHGLLGHYVPSDSADVKRYALTALATLAAIALPLRVRLRGWSRSVFAAAALASGISLVAGFAPWQTLYSSERLGFELWSPPHSTDHGGLFASLLRYHWEFSAPLPEPDRAAAAALIARHADAVEAAPAAGAAADLPDIVVVQSESLFDPARLKGIEPAQTMPNLRRIAAQSTHGDLWVPTYGGGTIRTEFEVLTGVAMRYFPDVQYPYYKLAVPELPTLPSLLAAHGYRTLAVHPNDAAFWNRATTFRTMGFQDFDDDSRFGDAQREGYFVSDEALVDHVLQRLDEGGAPLFVFAISIENHGPYDESPGIDERRRDAEPVPPGAPPAAALELRDYLYHVSNADRSLGRLADALAKRQRRTLLLFYGDHLPALNETYRSAGFDDGIAETSQPVPYLLFDSKAPQEQVQATASYFLPARLLAAAGIGDPYFRTLDAIRAETQFGPDYTPAEDTGLCALMRMRQLGEQPLVKMAMP